MSICGSADRAVHIFFLESGLAFVQLVVRWRRIISGGGRGPRLGPARARPAAAAPRPSRTNDDRLRIFYSNHEKKK